MPVRIIKIGGLAGLLAAALFAICVVIDQVAPVDVVYDSANEYVYSAVSMVAFLAVVVAVFGVRTLASQAGKLQRLSTVAAWLVSLGYGFVALLNAINLIQGERTLNTVRLGAALLMLIGSVILGVAVLVTRVLPWWSGVLLIIAFPLGHFANAVLPSAENVLYVLLWGSVGLALLSRADGPAQRAEVAQIRDVSQQVL
jgi:hypothetical protein